MRTVVAFFLFVVCLGTALAEPAAAFPGAKSDWRGFDRYDFEVDGRKALVVLPKEPASGKPWIWRAEFFDHRPESLSDFGLAAMVLELLF